MKNYKHIPGFLSQKEIQECLAWKPPLNDAVFKNEHIGKVNSETVGGSVLCDFSQTEISREVAIFQGDATVISESPEIFHRIADRICDSDIPGDHVFFQAIWLGAGGKVRSHYDAGKPGYSTYKCNIYLQGPEQDSIWIDGDEFQYSIGDLSCFEANLYKHWLDKSDVPRMYLSYGFIVPIEFMGWEKDDPRIRLSDRIWRKFIGRV